MSSMRIVSNSEERLSQCDPRDPLLQERETTHGPFAKTSRIAQDLKAIYRHYGYDKLPSAQREALDQIASKVARILAGNAGEPDHWNDVAGYAKLGSEACGDR